MATFVPEEVTAATNVCAGVVADAWPAGSGIGTSRLDGEGRWVSGEHEMEKAMSSVECEVPEAGARRGSVAEKRVTMNLTGSGGIGETVRGRRGGALIVPGAPLAQQGDGGRMQAAAAGEGLLLRAASRLGLHVWTELDPAWRRRWGGAHEQVPGTWTAVVGEAVGACREGGSCGCCGYHG